MGSSGPSRKTSLRLLKHVPLPKYRPRGLPLLSELFVGVGKYPNSVPTMPGAKVGSWKAMPFRIIPDLGQVSENSAKPCSRSVTGPTKDVCDVLQDRDAWSYLINQSDQLGIEAASSAFIQSNFGPGDANILAREPTRDDINGNSVASKSVGCEFSYVMIAGNLWPMFLEDAPREFFDLAERHGLKATSAL